MLELLGQHLVLALLPLLIGLAAALPLGWAAQRSRWLRAAVFGSATVVYTVPVLALDLFPGGGLARRPGALARPGRGRSAHRGAPVLHRRCSAHRLGGRGTGGVAGGAHRPRRVVLVGSANAMRALPTLGLLTFLFLLLRSQGVATLVALVVLAVPPVLAGSYAGVRSVESGVVDAARGMGMTSAQRLWQVELPGAVALLLGGVRRVVLTPKLTELNRRITQDRAAPADLAKELVNGLP
ncbi:MAG TPA: ABC transporter permease subunit [Pseudonocardiaceae bacterium]|nr:ABC transporter permease subunit [Pseudonocardiaceae bacterium]